MTSKGTYTKYNDISTLDALLSADNILSAWQEDRNRLAAINTPQVPHEGILPIDNHCQSCGGWGPRPLSLRQPCAGCILLTRLCPRSRVPETGVVTLSHGKFSGKQLAMRISDSYLTKFQSYPENTALGESLLGRLRRLQLCEPQFINQSRAVFLGSSGPTIYSLISSVLESQMKTQGLPCLPTYLWSYGCNGKTFVVDEVTDLGSGTLSVIASSYELTEPPRSPLARSSPFCPLRTEVARGILEQLVVTQHFLSQFGFVHGEPSLRSLAFDRRPVNFRYQGLPISSPIGLRLVPSTWSSATFSIGDNKVRYFNWSEQYSSSPLDSLPIEEIVPFLAEVASAGYCSSTSSSVPLLPELDGCRVLGYRIGEKLEVFQHLTRGEGVPLMFTSFDLYCYLVGLMAEESFYQAIMTNEELRVIWKGLWHPREFSALQSELSTLRGRETADPPSSSVLVKLVSRFTLRCDALTYLWNQLLVGKV